ncbi:MAG TPA: hypothetical protein VD902_05595 [Symbiobacteriaceae bacterium]|nr:hypothetical protein [Symbiobacteriaceae bacterium]
MIIEQTWRRYRDNWPVLLAAGVQAAALYEVLRLLSSLIGVPLADTPGRFSLGTAAVLALTVTIAMPLATGGLAYTALQVQRGRSVTPAEIWPAARRNWRRLLRLSVTFVGIAALVGLLAIPLSLVPVPGLVVWGIGAGMIMVVLYGYGPLLVVGENLGATEAVRKAFQVLSARFVDVFWTMLVLFLFATVLGLASSGLVRFGLVGHLLTLALDATIMPGMYLYLAFRYQANVAPYMGPGAREGAFHPDPPGGL